MVQSLSQHHVKMTILNRFNNSESVSAANVKKKKSVAGIAKKVCSKKNLKNRFPIAKWLPQYTFSKFLRDVLAGATVGATCVAQGIAYSAIAGLPTEYGLYSGLVGGFIYVIFGNCINMSIGPTAIVSALVSRYVKGMSPDFAVLLAFLTGIVQIALGVFQLGFLVEFLSTPVISGFTTAAAIQICTSQLKSFFGTAGKSGNSFLEAVTSLVQNIKTINPWDTALGVVSIILIFGLKKQGQGIKQTGTIRTVRRAMSLMRNVFVIILGLIISYILYKTSYGELLSVIGDINGGLPEFKPPPFTTTVGNETYTFVDMLKTLGPQSLVLPLVAIMEVVIISKAFTPDTQLDATQEIVALGIANLMGSFVGAMPVTGAFSRSALMDASGVQTTAAGIVVSGFVILSLSLFTSVFYFIPKTSLSAMIMIAVCALVDLEEIVYLWKSSKREMCVLLVTIISALTMGLEFGVIVGVIVDLILILLKSARPSINVSVAKFGGKNVVLFRLPDNLAFCCGDYIRSIIIKKMKIHNASLLIVDGTNTVSMDSTVISNLMSMLNNIENSDTKIVFVNFNDRLRRNCIEKEPKHENKFMTEAALEKLLEDDSVVVVFDN